MRVNVYVHCYYRTVIRMACHCYGQILHMSISVRSVATMTRPREPHPEPSCSSGSVPCHLAACVLHSKTKLDSCPLYIDDAAAPSSPHDYLTLHWADLVAARTQMAVRTLFCTRLAKMQHVPENDIYPEHLSLSAVASSTDDMTSSCFSHYTRLLRLWTSLSRLLAS